MKVELRDATGDLAVEYDPDGMVRLLYEMPFGSQLTASLTASDAETLGEALCLAARRAVQARTSTFPAGGGRIKAAPVPPRVDVPRAPEHDLDARGANHEELVGLLCFRQATASKLKPDHPALEAIFRARDQAKAEVLWRLHRAEGPTPGIPFPAEVPTRAAGPADYPWPKCGRCKHHYDTHIGGCVVADCSCPRYLFPELA